MKDRSTRFSIFPLPAVILFISALNLIGWIADVPFLTGLLPGWATMEVVTALCFLLLSGIFMTHVIPATGRRFRNISGISLFVLLFLSTSTLLNYLVELATKNQFSFASNLIAAVYLGESQRMSLITACCFMLSAGVLAALQKGGKKSSETAHALVLPILITSYTVTVSYFFNVSIFHRSTAMSISIYTAVCFLLFSAAVFLMDKKTWLTKTFFENAPSSLSAKHLAALILPIVWLFGILLLKLRQHHLITQEGDLSLLVSLLSLGMGLIIWWHTKLLNKAYEKQYVLNEDLRQSELQYKNVLDSMLEGVQIIGRDWKYKYLNDAVIEHARYPRERLIGHTMMEVYPGIENTELFSRIQDCMENRTSHRMNNQFSYPGGDSAWFKLGIQPIREGVSILSIDITDYMETAEKLKIMNSQLEERVAQSTAELKISEERYRALFNMGDDIIMALRIQEGGLPGKYIEVNDAACRKLEYTREELLNLSPMDIDTELETIMDEADQIGQEIEDSGRSIIYRSYATKSGKTIPLEISISSFLYRGENIGLTISRDISDRLEAEKKLKKAKEEAEAANKTKTFFLANISHEIRTPLNAIIGYSQLLGIDKQLTPDQREKIEIISRSGDHLLNLINDVIDVSKIESGFIDLFETTFSIHAFLAGIKSMFQLKVELKGIQYLFQEQEGLPEYIVADESKLRQIFINLISNAVKFTQTGEIIVAISWKRKNKEDIILSAQVSDTGLGIPQDKQKNIFNIFYQTDEGRGQGGTGLGLVISKKYAGLMGGDLTFTSTEGQGTTFFLTVTVKKGRMENTTYPLETGNVVAIKSRKRKFRILITDDVKENRTLLADFLGNIGFEIAMAENGLEAWEKAKKIKPDLILMDLVMPVMDGYAAIKKMKASEDLKNIPIIAITASTLGQEKEKVLAIGASSYFSKPFKQSEILGTIKMILDLEYVYGEKEEKNTGLKMTLDHSLIELPGGYANRMIEADRELDQEKLLNIADEIEKEFPDLGIYFKQLISQYKNDQLIRILTSRKIEQ